MDIVSQAAQTLARRSSRRQFFKFLGAGSLGAGLMFSPAPMSRSARSPAASAAAAGPAIRAARLSPPCANIGQPCKPCQQGGGCPERLHDDRRVVLLPE